MENRIKELAEEGMGYRLINRALVAEGFDSSERRVRRALKELRGTLPPETLPETRSQVTQTLSGDTLQVESRGRIRTLEELLAVVKPDLELWEVGTYKANCWEMPKKENGVTQLWQVNATFKRRREVFELREMQAAAIAEMQAYSPVHVKPKYRVATGEAHMLEIATPDLHAGKLAHKDEVGANYDLKLARARFEAAVTDLLAKSSGAKIERIVFVIGNDLLHVDNAENTTTAGTKQDVDGRYQKVYREVLNMIVWAVDQMLMVAPVHIPVVAGNHARSLEGLLGETIKVWYRLNPAVTVDASAKTRKYVAYGANLIGFTHGDGAKAAELPLIMAEEEPELWAGSKWREWHTGHLHQRRATRYQPLEEHHGVAVRISPALSGVDSWSYSKGYTGNHKAAEAYLWCKRRGLVAQFYSTAEK